MGYADRQAPDHESIVLLIDDSGDRTRLTEILGDAYTIMSGPPREVLAQQFDVCIVDIPNLDRYEHLLGGRKTQGEPVFLPVLAMLASDEAPLLSGRMGRSVDEVIMTPLMELTVHARVSSLIRIRRLSLEAERLSRATGERTRTHLRLAVDAANVGLWDWNLRTGEVFFSRQWKEQIGYEDTEIPDEYGEWESRLHPDDAAWVVQKVYDFARYPRRPIQFEYRLRHKDGSYRWILARATLVLDKDGKAVRMLGVHLDITRRKRSEEVIAQERNLANAIIDSMPGVFYVFSLNQRFMRWNRNFQAVTGYSDEEMERVSVLELFRGSDRELIARRVAQAVETGQADAEATLMTKDGRGIAYYFTGRRIELEGRICIIGMGLDITKRKLAEEGLKSSLRDKEILLQELYHRTKNNMQVISALLELQAALSGSEEARRLVADSQSRIRAMALAHEKLYQSRDLSRVNMREYLIELTQLVAAGRGVPADEIGAVFDIGEISLLIDLAIPCGLIVNELLSDYLQSAVSLGKGTRIDIGLRREGIHDLMLTVGHECGDTAESTSPTAGLVSRIVRHQLHGSMRAETNGRFQWHIGFRDDLYSERVRQ